MALVVPAMCNVAEKLPGALNQQCRCSAAFLRRSDRRPVREQGLAAGMRHSAAG